MLKAWTHSLVLACAALASACDFNNEGTALETPDSAAVPTPAPADAGPVVMASMDAGPTDLLDAQLHSDAAPSVDAAADAAPLEVIRNATFETATELFLPARMLQDIVRSAQKNYFVFEAEAGGFYELQTGTGQFSPDVSLFFYDENHKLLAQNDQGSLWPGDSIDARLIVRTPEAGRYFVRVDDSSTAPSFFTESSFLVRYYTLAVRALMAGSAGITYVDAGTPAAATFAFDADSTYLYTTVLGMLRPSQVETISVAGLADRALIGHVLEPGPAGDGSTGGAGPVQIRRNSDQQLLASSPGTPGQLQIFPPVASDVYSLLVNAPPVVGDNGFFAVDLVMLPDNPREQHEADNGVLAQAEPVMLTGRGYARGLFLSDVPGGDVDYFSFPATAGESALLSCTGESSGSGVRQLHVELRDAMDQTLATAVESPNHDLNISAFAIPTTGTYAVRLSSDHTAAAGEAEPWVRCAIQLTL